MTNLMWAVRTWIAANKTTVAFIVVVLIIAAVAPPLIKHATQKAPLTVQCTGAYVVTCTIGDQ
jgi:hypothetical protein